MQFEVHTNNAQRTNAIKSATFEKRLVKTIGCCLLLFFILCYTITYFVTNLGKVPTVAFVTNILMNPLYLIAAIILVNVFAKNNLPEYLQAQYLSGFANYRNPFTVDISEDGIACYNNEKRIGAFTYICFTAVKKNADSILLLDRNSVLFILPLECIESDEQVETIFSFLSKKVEAAQVNPQKCAELEIEPKQALSSFSYMSSNFTSTDIAKAMKKVIVPRKIWGFFSVILTIFGVIASIIIFSLTPDTAFLPAAVLCILVYFVLLAIFRRKSSSPITLEYVPAYYFGNTTLEILEEGMRVYNENFELFLNWEQPYRIIESSSGYVITLYGSFFAYIPVLFSTPEQVIQTIQYITSQDEPKHPQTTPFIFTQS